MATKRKARKTAEQIQATCREMTRKIQANIEYHERSMASDIIKYGFEGIRSNLQSCILGHMSILKEYGKA